MRIVKLALVVVWFASLVAQLVCLGLAFAVGKSVVSEQVLGSLVGLWLLLNGVLLIGVSGSVLLDLWFGVGFCALGVVALCVGGVLPEVVRPWAVGVFLAWFAVMGVAFGLAQVAAAREEQQAQKANPPRRPLQVGWTLEQLAQVLMLAGVGTVVAVLKCLIFGPPPYSVLAYFLGPVLIVASVLVAPHALRDLSTNGLRPRA